MLEELGLAYQIRRYQRDPNTLLAPDRLKQVHPLGKSPLLEKEGVVLAESGAIIQYLCENHGPEWIPPVGSRAYQDYQYWLHFAEGSLMPPMLLKLVMDKVRTSPMPFFVKPVARRIADKAMKSFIAVNIRNNLDFIEQSLEGRQWLTGDTPTGADVQMSFPLEAAVARGLVSEEQANIRAYVHRIHARAAYQRALQAGGEYAYA